MISVCHCLGWLAGLGLGGEKKRVLCCCWLLLLLLLAAAELAVLIWMCCAGCAALAVLRCLLRMLGLAGSGVRGRGPFLSLVVVCRETKNLPATSLLTKGHVNSAFLVVAKMRPQSLWSIRNAVLTDPAKTSSPRILGLRVCPALLPATALKDTWGPRAAAHLVAS